MASNDLVSLVMVLGIGVLVLVVIIVLWGQVSDGPMVLVAKTIDGVVALVSGTVRSIRGRPFREESTGPSSTNNTVEPDHS